MAIKVKSTRRDNHFVNILVYGEAGAGKTTLCATAPKPIIISAEQGLLSLSDKDIPVIEVSKLDEVKEAFKYVSSTDEYETVCIDSISELGESLLAEFKLATKDPRQAYGQMNDEMSGIVRRFRDIPNKNVLFIAKQQRIVDEYTGKINFGPSMPGKSFAMNLPYFFDIVACLRIGKKEKEEYRYLQTQPTIQYEAKDRSGRLSPEEAPNLTQLFNKVVGK